MGRVSEMKRALLSMIILLLAISISGNVYGASCESCHSSSIPSGGWIYHPPVITLLHDPFYLPGADVTIRLIVTPASDYSISSLSGELGTIYGSLTSTGSGTSGVDPQGNRYIDWTFTAGDVGESIVIVDVDYTVYYKHKTPGTMDSASYYDRIETTVQVADLDLSISPGTLIFEKEGEEKKVELTANSDVTGIEVILHGSLVGLVTFSLPVVELSQDGSATITVTVLNRTNIKSFMTIRWLEGDVQREIEIEIVITDPGESGGSDLLWEVGKYTGISAAVLVLVGFFTGGTSKLKAIANKVFGSAKRRVDFHCALSFVTLILVAIHFATLFYGPFRNLIFQWEVILGEVAMLIMVIISLNGIFQKKFIKLLGFQNWRRVHAWGSYLITVLVSIHMLLYGSHFVWFRELIGY